MTPPSIHAAQPRSRPLPRLRPRRTAFTLIEVMMVLLILGTLLGLVVGLARHTRETAAKAKAIAELGELHNGLAQYFTVHEAYPDPYAGGAVAITNVWLQRPAWAPPAVADTMESDRWTLLHYLPMGFHGIDPWGSAYQYQHDATNAPLAYRLFSLGPNPMDPHARVFFQP